MTDEEIRSLFRDLRDEPIPTDALARFRSGLEQKLERRRAFWRTPVWALAGAFLVLAAIAFEWWPAMRNREELTVARHVPPPPPIELPLEFPKPAIAPAIIRTPRRRRHVQPSPAVSIRIETPDPNVVILLVGD